MHGIFQIFGALAHIGLHANQANLLGVSLASADQATGNFVSPSGRLSVKRCPSQTPSSNINSNATADPDGRIVAGVQVKTATHHCSLQVSSTLVRLTRPVCL